MDAQKSNTKTQYKVVHQTIFGCPVSIRADTQKTPVSDLAVLRFLAAAYEERIKKEKTQ